MKIIFVITFFVIAVGLLGGVGYFLFKDKVTPIKLIDQVLETNDTIKLVDFFEINPEFLFLAEIPKEFEAEYVPQLKAINIYNPLLQGNNNIEKSQVYISFFKASKFLTLNTVNITKQEKTIIHGKEAILYEITKKDGVPNFLVISYKMASFPCMIVFSCLVILTVFKVKNLLALKKLIYTWDFSILLLPCKSGLYIFIAFN